MSGKLPETQESNQNIGKTNSRNLLLLVGIGAAPTVGFCVIGTQKRCLLFRSEVAMTEPVLQERQLKNDNLMCEMSIKIDLECSL